MKVSIKLNKRTKTVTIKGTDTVGGPTHKAYSIKGTQEPWVAGVYDSSVTINTGWVLKRNAKHTEIERVFITVPQAKKWADNAALALKEFYKDIK